jgi:site-specific DNA recombinase
MPRAVIYCRVSTKEQTQNLSLPTQRRACEEYCRREGLEVARVFLEKGESAKTANRTELNALLAFCRENKRTLGFVVVYNLSRFSRDTRAHYALTGLLMGWSIALRSATEPIDSTSSGRLMESVIASIAQFDNDVKAERTRAGMRAALESGRWTFQAPLGYLSGQRGGPSLVLDPVRGALIREAYSDYASGRFSKPELLQRLTARGLATRRGRPLSPQTFNALLRNPIYEGRIAVAAWGISGRGDFEPLVPPAVFARVQTRLKGRLTRVVPHARNHPDFPLRRFVTCGECGKPLTGAWSRGRSGRYAYYECPECRRVRVPKAELEGAFLELVTRLQPRVEYMRLFNEIVLDVWRQRQASARETRARLQGQVSGHRQKLDDLDDAFLFRHVIDQRTYERQRDLLREKVALAEVELDEATGENLEVEAILAFAQEVLTNAARLWEQAPLEHKQRLQRAFFPEGLVFDGSGFRTAVTCLAFKALAGPESVETCLASPTGLEPP